MRNYYYHYQTSSSVASIMSSTGAGRLLGTETQGLTIDCADMSMVVRDTGTPANAFSGNPNSKLTYNSPSTKLILGSDGLYVGGTTLRTSYNSSGTALGVLIEEARTNICLQSNDLTNASWTKSNLTTAKTATGPDGVANSATTITASAGNATALQAITSGSAARITSVFLKRRTGTGNVDVTQDNGTTWATQAIASSWSRYEIASVTSANPTVGIRLVTNGDAVDVAYFQHEVGSFVTSPIVTVGATVTRSADNISLATSAFPSIGSAGTIYCAGRTLSNNSATSYAIQMFTDGSNFSAIRNDSGAGAQGIVFTGGALVAAPAVFNWATGVQAKVAMRLNTNNTNICSASTLGTNDTTCAMPAYSALYIGSNGGVGQFNGYLSQIMVLPRALSDAELQTLTT